MIRLDADDAPRFIAAVRLEPNQRVLELGWDKPFTQLLPERTDHFVTCTSRSASRRAPGELLTRAAWTQVEADLARGVYGLVVLNPLGVSPWNAEHPLSRNLAQAIRHAAFFPARAPYLALRAAGRHGVPAIVLDYGDEMIVPPANFRLFPSLRGYFKRELPQNRWHVFLNGTRRNGDVSNIRRQPVFREATAKLHPLPLHAEPLRASYPAVNAADKKTDIFYVGEDAKTTVRVEGRRQLDFLREAGFIVDAPDAMLPREEFHRRMEQAWLAWSPAGSGWDCHRHYESLVHGAVPVMNYPTIERYRPLLDRQHAFYYGVEGTGLADVARAALADKPALLEMVRRGREHLQQAYTPPAILEYIFSQI